MKWKTKEGDGGEILIIAREVDGVVQPVYEKDGGAESTFDADHAVTKIKELSDLRDKKLNPKIEELSGKIEKWNELGVDIEEVNDALKKARDLKGAKLIEAGKVEQIRTEAVKETQTSYEKKLKDKSVVIDGLNETVRRLTVGKSFSDAEPVLKETIWDGAPDLAEAVFGSHFRSEEKDGKIVVRAYHDKSGERPVLSEDKPGEPAGFNEALTILINNHPQKERIWKADSRRGTGDDRKDGPLKGVELVASKVEGMDQKAFEESRKKGQTFG